MVAIPPLNLDDAEACLARAQRHYAELRALTDPGKLWGFSEEQDGDTGEWFNCLHLDRARLVAAKPVLADSATNAISALDHVAAAIAKANGHERLRWLHYPLGLTDDDFKEACGKTKDALGDAMLWNSGDGMPIYAHRPVADAMLDGPSFVLRRPGNSSGCHRPIE